MRASPIPAGVACDALRKRRQSPGSHNPPGRRGNTDFFSERLSSHQRSLAERRSPGWLHSGRRPIAGLLVGRGCDLGRQNRQTGEVGYSAFRRRRFAGWIRDDRIMAQGFPLQSACGTSARRASRNYPAGGTKRETFSENPGRTDGASSISPGRTMRLVLPFSNT